MEFWGVEVKGGQPLKINPGDNKIVHLSQASLGEVKKGSEPVFLYLKVNDKKLVLGTLSAEKFPQLSFDLVVEKDFELSHNWKNGSVYFTGYKIHADEGTDTEDDGTPEYDDGVKEVPLTNKGVDASQPKSLSEKTNATKPDSSAAHQKVKDAKPNQKAEDSDSDDDDLEGSSTDDDKSQDDENPNLVNHEAESDESSGEEDESDEDDDEDTDDSESDDEEEETPAKAEVRNKRPADSATKTPVPDKKPKFITPQKTGDLFVQGKKGISYTATPHPSKQAGKTPANSDQTKQQFKKSGGSYPCKSCNRSFTTEGGLQAHTKAKHAAAV